jgi:hypothetical protein
MTSTEKLIKKEFKLKSEEEIYAKIDTKSEAFFKNNFFTDKATYLKMIKTLVNSINIDGDHYAEYLDMARSGSILESSWTSSNVANIKSKYVANRKKLINHIRFFV